MTMRHVLRFRSTAVVVALIVCGYLALQLHAIAFRGYEAQDFGAHVSMIELALTKPFQFWFQPLPDRANPPLYFSIGALVKVIFGGGRYLPVLSVLVTISNLAATLLLYSSCASLFRRQALWIFALLSTLFLPAYVISSAAIATDGLFTALYITTVALLIYLMRSKSQRQRFWLAIFGGLALSLALLTKLSAMFLLPVPWLCMWYLAKHRSLHRREIVALSVLFCILPTSLGAIQYLVYGPAYSRPFAIDRSINPFASPYMNVRSLLFFRDEDSFILSAPPYNISLGGAFIDTSGYDPEGKLGRLLVANRHSYPALLTLSAFTDVLNRYQHEPVRTYFGRRSAEAQSVMALAIKTGLLFFLVVAILSPVVTIIALKEAVATGDPAQQIFTILGLAGFLLVVGLMANLPFTPSAYMAGAWMARYILPAVILLVLLSCAAIDKLFRDVHPGVMWFIGLAALFQSALHVSFLWTGLLEP